MFIRSVIRNRGLLALAAASLPLALLSGCTMGDIHLSGPDNSPVKVAVHITGTVHGGQQPISGSTIQLYQTGTSGYGSTASALIIPGGIGSVTITNGGVGYSSTPTVTFSGGGATTQATATAALGSGANTGQVVTLTLTSSGAGYTSAPTITFSGGGTPTTAAAATAVVVPTGGVLSDANGNFSITGEYTCPFPSSAMVYITAMNGNPGLSGTNVSNGAIRLIEPLGPCSGLSNATTVALNEVTTAATAFAMGQYFTTSYGGTSIDSFGAPNTTQAQLGINNAYATYLNLVTSNGFANTGSTVSNSVGTVTITPEASKLYTIADILAACVNTTSAGSTQCTTLFADVTPTNPPGTTTGTAKLATDVLQAAVYMSLNPTSTNANGSSANLTALYGLQTGTASPYPGLSTQPTDWTLGITYSSTSANSGINVLNKPEFLAIDASGDIWVANYSSTTATTNNSVTELANNGAPLAQVLTTAGLIAPSYIAIDPTGNVWVPDYGASGAGTFVAEYTTSGSTKTYTTNAGPQKLAIDGAGDVFVFEPKYKGLGDLEEITAGANSGSSAATLASGLVSDFSNLAIDSNYTVWVTGGNATGQTAGTNSVYQFLYSSTSPHYPSTPSYTATSSAIVGPENSIAVDNSNNVWVQNYAAESYFTLKGTTTVTSTSGPSFTNLPAPEFEAIDGNGNVWTTDAASPTATIPGSVYEQSNAGAAISPSVGYVHSYYYPYGIGIDPSGNVWIGSENGSAYTPQITEIVGAAVPVVTPIAAGLPATAGGTNLLGTRP